jgi:hypothetical protein
MTDLRLSFCLRHVLQRGTPLPRILPQDTHYIKLCSRKSCYQTLLKGILHKLFPVVQHAFNRLTFAYSFYPVSHAMRNISNTPTLLSRSFACFNMSTQCIQLFFFKKRLLLNVSRDSNTLCSLVVIMVDLKAFVVEFRVTSTLYISTTQLLPRLPPVISNPTHLLFTLSRAFSVATIFEHLVIRFVLFLLMAGGLIILSRTGLN